MRRTVSQVRPGGRLGSLRCAVVGGPLPELRERSGSLGQCSATGRSVAPDTRNGAGRRLRHRGRRGLASLAGLAGHCGRRLADGRGADPGPRATAGCRGSRPGDRSGRRNRRLATAAAVRSGDQFVCASGAAVRRLRRAVGRRRRSRWGAAGHRSDLDHSATHSPCSAAIDTVTAVRVLDPSRWTVLVAEKRTRSVLRGSTELTFADVVVTARRNPTG